MIVIVSNKWDLTVDFVVLALQGLDRPFARINCEDLPSADASIFLPGFSAQLLTSQLRLSFDAVKVVWLRRPGYIFDQLAPEQRPSSVVQLFVEQQWRAWRDGLEIAPNIHWVNRPSAEQRAENKIRQLQVAKECGLQVPDTAVTNSPRVIRDFLLKHDYKIVVKALQSPLLEDEGGDRFVFTNPLTSMDDVDESEIRVAPIIVQQRIIPKIDYRITVVGEQVLAVRVLSETGQVELDWRTQQAGLRFERCTLPPRVEAACRNYVRAMGLRFGAIDLLEARDQFFFLEINPNGEWGWLQKKAGVPIAEALTDLLVQLDNDSNEP